MARLPELAAVLGPLGVSVVPSSFRARDFGERLDLLAGRRRGPVKLEKERRRLGQTEMRISVAGADLHLVEQFDAGKRDAHLQRGDGGVAGAFDRGERADRGEDRLGNAVKLEGEASDDAE